MSDAPLGCLLSGGLDSSLVASIAVRHLREATNAVNREHKLHTFSIGIAGSPDLVVSGQRGRGAGGGGGRAGKQAGNGERRRGHPPTTLPCTLPPAHPTGCAQGV